jgi:hypothetical protein
MRIARRLAAGLALAGAIVLAIVPAASADPVRYTNPRYGTTVVFPGEVFSEPQPPSDNGDGMSWRAADGGFLAVWGMFNALGQTPGEFADWESEDQGPGYQVTYRRVADDWVVVSGYDGDMVFYKRFEFGKDDVIHALLIIYPTARNAVYDRLVGSIAASFNGP